MSLYARFENEISIKMKDAILKNVAQQFKYLYNKELYEQLKQVSNFNLPDAKKFRLFSEDLKQIKAKFLLTDEEFDDYDQRWEKFNKEFKEFCEYFGFNVRLSCLINSKFSKQNLNYNLDFAFDTIIIAKNLDKFKINEILEKECLESYEYNSIWVCVLQSPRQIKQSSVVNTPNFLFWLATPKASIALLFLLLF